jgi:hypothetical protein
MIKAEENPPSPRCVSPRTGIINTVMRGDLPTGRQARVTAIHVTSWELTNHYFNANENLILTGGQIYFWTATINNDSTCWKKTSIKM